MAKYKIIPSSRTIVHSPISIGHKAEKGVKAIEFDLTAWVETYGSGTLTVIMRRWGDAIPYPIALEIGEDNKATWTLSDIDTAKAGMAYAQLNYIVGDEVVKKSDIYTFRVMDSLTGEGEPPEAYESWLEHLTHLAAEAMAEVLDIEGIVTDKTLTVDGGIADGKATGDALALKADKSTTYTKTEVDQMIEDVEVETDTTLSVSGAPADAKKTGDELSALKADLGDFAYRNSCDLLKLYADHNRYSGSAIVAEWDGNKCTITGVATSAVRIYLANYTDGLPYWLVAGKKYRLNYTSENVYFRIYSVKDGTDTQLLLTKSDADFTIPDDSEGIKMMFYFASGTDLSNGETVYPVIISADSNQELDEKIKNNTSRIDRSESDIQTVKEIIDSDNSSEFIRTIAKQDKTVSGVTFTWEGNKCKVEGTANSTVSYVLLMPQTELPEFFDPEREYYVLYNSENVTFRIVGYIDGVAQSGYLFNGMRDAVLNIPNGYNGISMQLRVSAGAIVDETVEINICTAHRNIDLQTDILETNTKLNIVASDIGSLTDLGIEADNFSGLQQVCVHHDNFFRNVNDWNIGENGNSAFHMTYTNPNDNNVDDGFRITDNILTNDKSVSKSYGYRIVDNKQNSNTLLIELSAPSRTDGNTTMFTFGFEDINHNWLVRTTYTQSNNSYGIFIRRIVNGIAGTETRIATVSIFVNTFRFLLNNGEVYVYADDALLNINGYSVDFNASDAVGLVVAKQYTIETRFFNVFHFRPFATMNPNYAYDANDTNYYPYSYHETVGNTPSYAWTLDNTDTRFSQYSERFELRKTDPYVNGSPRTENAFSGIFRNNLRKMVISFDIKLDDFATDPAFDMLFQIHDLAEETDNLQRNPNYIFFIENGKWGINVRGWYGKSNEKDTDVPDEQDTQYIFADVESDKWIHFELRIKEGYEIGHHPLTELYMDGRLVFKSHALNTYNRARGGYVKYGIYKTSWKSMESTVTKRIVHFDNFMYKI